MKTYIIGHQKPDTDAVVATLAFKHIFNQADCWGHSDSVACITHNLNPETKYVFEKFKIPFPQLITANDIKPEDKIVLVDHNEVSQALEGLDYSQVTDIFDHHKINLNLEQPIYVTSKAWGSTCTIAWHLMNLYQYPIPKDLASLMLAAILSDTVGFKSPTTTDVDKKASQSLAKTANIQNLDGLTLEIFRAKSDVSKLTDEQIVQNDYKIYDFKQKVFIGVIETVEQEKILQTRKSSLLKAMQKIKNQQNISAMFLCVSNILNLNTKILILSDTEKLIAQKAFNGQVKDNLLDIGPKISRKKDIAPAIERAIKN